jgi:hypothetical protein
VEIREDPARHFKRGHGIADLPGPVSVTTGVACRISIAMDRPLPVLFYAAPTRGRFFILSQGEGLFLCLRKSHAGC